jgi:predicted amidohydrolase
LVAEAASAGAQLIVLPEVFNTGYTFESANYGLAEPIDGMTAMWMREQAAAHNIYLAGTFMLRDEEDVYNTALLIAPDGQQWRYDKQFPFLWERAYFREGDRITVADTDLGKLGMMICWDAAHASVWARYAGKVDGLIVMSCPPKLSAADLVFPNGQRVNVRELGANWERFYTDEEYFTGADMDQQAAWLRVPVVATVGAGTFRSRLPLPHVSLLPYVAARTDLWEKLRSAPNVQIEAGFDPQTKIISPNGTVLDRVTTGGEGFALAEVTLPKTTPQPTAPQPKMRTHSAVYMLADVLAPSLLVPLYRRGIRRQWGREMAPLEMRTKIWLGLVGAAATLGWLIGRIGGER